MRLSPCARRTAMVVTAATLLSSPAAVAAEHDPTPGWWSGASGNGVPDGGFGAWRGSPVEIASTWNDSREAQTEQWSITEQFGSWRGPIDNAIGAIYDGETWQAAASGAYDGRWRAALTKLAQVWGDRPQSDLYIRFAHEMNGNWMSWSVRPGEEGDFVTAWQRFHAIQEEVLPGANLVWSPNDGTRQDYDVRRLWPGREHADVIGVDSYNHWPHNVSEPAAREDMLQTQADGSPEGVEQWRRFAESVGVPLALPEWGNPGQHRSAPDGGGGESPAYVRVMHEWFAEHAGAGPGQILYEAYFNVDGYDARFELWPDTVQPQTAQEYAALF